MAYKPNYHIYKLNSWINDPNGFTYFKGKYHLFAQCYPHALKWGPMEWAHFTSKDLISWKDNGIALKGSEDYDLEFGCFSGSSIVKDDILYILYTGVSNGKQQQCLATSKDGKKFTKYEHNPVIGEKELPSEYQISDFRDPKVILHDGVYYVLVGAKHKDNSAHILLFKSKDLLHYEFVNSIYRYESKKGGMMECPDLFFYKDKCVLIYCPQFDKTRSNQLKNIHGCYYVVGNLDFIKGTFTPISKPRLVDQGFDYYATQTLTRKNKTYLVAWQSMWDRNYPTIKENYVGQMTSIREVKIKNGKLYQSFLKGISKYYSDEYVKDEIKVNHIYQEDDIRNRLVRLTFDLMINQGDKAEITLNDSLTINIDKSHKIIELNRSNMDEDIINNDGSKSIIRRIKYIGRKPSIHFDILIDNSCIEILINNGKYAASVLNYKNNGKLFKVNYFDGEGSLLNYRRYYLRGKEE